MKHDPQISRDQIETLIRTAESRYDFCLSIEDFDFLVFSASQFVNPLIDKFVQGAKEHYEPGNNFVHSVDHKQEITKEILDLWNYHQANLFRNQSKS